ncbi:HNH endonuclease [Bdellovibrio sp. HCB290]|uniref:HNH endonuclease n=1 Tax=Bdellovibrio sp. HCB290 TaxID=3394356 RepID=UPI0039B4FC24
MSAISDMYLETLKSINGWVTVSEWAVKVGEMYPELLEKAHREALNHKTPSTGLREIAARISSWVSTGGFGAVVEVDESERPKRVRYLSSEQLESIVEKEIEEDTEPLTRYQLVKRQLEDLSVAELYRIEEMENIASSFNSLFNLDFEVDHASAILNSEKPGRHHPNNLQILIKSHNRTKSSSNWRRFSIEEQIEYIKSVLKTHDFVAKRMSVQIEHKVIESLLQRLKMVFD